MGKSTISMAIFNSYVSHNQAGYIIFPEVSIASVSNIGEHLPPNIPPRYTRPGKLTLGPWQSDRAWKMNVKPLKMGDKIGVIK